MIDPSGFTEFWSVYPRKVARKAAVRAYSKAVKVVLSETIIYGAARYARERDGQDATYTKHPTTWLNGGCWDDEAATVRQRSGVIGALDRLEQYLTDVDDCKRQLTVGQIGGRRIL